MYSIPVSTRPVQSVRPEAKTAFAVIGMILVGTGSLYELDRTESWKHHIQPRVPFILDAADASRGGAECPDVRNASEHIESIRNVLNPAITDLAGLFDVSRQAIYKWLSGDSTPEPDKLNRIVELSRIADAFQAAGVSRAGALLKMKAFAGRSLIDLIKSGENRSEHLAALISESKSMEASYKQSGLATSKSKSSSDWQSSISIPGSSERV
jgi:transcriptional regulator with XRE-family HTH domain